MLRDCKKMMVYFPAPFWDWSHRNTQHELKNPFHTQNKDNKSKKGLVQNTTIYFYICVVYLIYWRLSVSRGLAESMNVWDKKKLRYVTWMFSHQRTTRSKILNLYIKNLLTAEECNFQFNCTRSLFSWWKSFYFSLVAKSKKNLSKMHCLAKGKIY